jgi:multisubunit Na+/H+ antiporter MnhB subunit
MSAVRLAVPALASTLGALLIAAMLALPAPPTRLAAEVEGRLADSGVSHPVTAVLLNFRAYDTLLEIAVLAAALLAALALSASVAPAAPAGGETAGAILRALPHLVVPVAVLTAAYLLWAGSTQPGGAFQAGAVLGGAGVLLHLAGWRLPLATPSLALRAALMLGLVAFLTVALTGAGLGQALLTYPRALAGPLILAIELTLTLSIGVILVTLFSVASRTGLALGPAPDGDGASRGGGARR